MAKSKTNDPGLPTKGVGQPGLGVWEALFQTESFRTAYALSSDPIQKPILRQNRKSELRLGWMTQGVGYKNGFMVEMTQLTFALKTPSEKVRGQMKKQ